MSIKPHETWSLDSDFEGRTLWIRDQRWGGALQVVWEGQSGTASVRFELSSDGETWAPWPALAVTSGSAETDVDLTGSEGTHLWEVTRWTGRYLRIISTAGSATSGTANFYLTNNKG